MDGERKLDFVLRRGQKPTVKLPRLDEKKRERPVPVVIDPFEPRMPINRSVQK